MITVLFVCVENAGRSQMAEGFGKVIGKGFAEVYSAGSTPSGRLNPVAVEAMKEKGIDISTHHSKGFRDLPVPSFDYVATMGCGDACPIVPAQGRVDWTIDNPKQQPIETVRRIRDEIERHVSTLFTSIKRIEQFKALLQKDPNDTLSHYGMGLEYTKVGLFTRATETFREAVRLNPEYSSGYRELGKSLIQEGKSVEAQRVLQQGLTVAERHGDLQTVKEIKVFLSRID
ncbi:MAG: hypothetical protein HYZ73_08085 [Elusimicrobia bacterium]|nr:hypothetical protein [Elusimicrobiota bacterium]